VSRFKCGFVLVALLNTYVVVSLANVELGEYNGSSEVADEITNEREGVLITNRPGVDFPVILYWS
jgi:hypothetical protein